jgi:hypothetical protein
MAQRKQQVKRTAAAARESDERKIRRLGNRWIHEHLPTDYTSGTPRHQHTSVWTVPILLAYPGLVLGQVGVLTIDLETEQVLQHTPPEHILATGDRLVEQHAETTEATSLRAREG